MTLDSPGACQNLKFVLNTYFQDFDEQDDYK